MPRLNLHADGAALAVMATVFYGSTGLSWWLFAALILAPDLFMLGYIAGPEAGARIYNIGHSKVWPTALILSGFYMNGVMLTGIGLVWAAHIGIDNLFGYGYKYPEGFKVTHFKKV